MHVIVKPDRLAPRHVPLLSNVKNFIIGVPAYLGTKNDKADQKWLRPTKKLSKKELAYEQLRNEVPACLENYDLLREFSAESAGISGIKNLAYHPVLKKLDLYNNNITDITPLKDIGTFNVTNSKGRANTKHSRMLKEVNLGGNYITDASVLGELEGVQRVNLGTNPIQDVTFLKDMHGLNFLDLDALQHRLFKRTGWKEELPVDAPANMVLEKGVQGEKLVIDVFSNLQNEDGIPPFIMMRFNDTPVFSCIAESAIHVGVPTMKTFERAYFNQFSTEKVMECIKSGDFEFAGKKKAMNDIMTNEFGMETEG